MLHLFSGSRRTSHPHVFERTSQPRFHVSFHVGECEEKIGLLDSPGNFHGEKCFPAMATFFFIPSQPVGDDDGHRNRRVRESVKERRFQVIHRIVAKPGIEGIGVGEERLPSCLSDGFHNGAHENRLDEPVIAPLAEVEFHGHKVILLYPSRK